MRHGKKFNHLSRKSAHRKAMLANMACSLIEHKSIKTTLAKAKALRVYIEPLITKSKNDTTHSRRIVFSYLKQKEAVSELFNAISMKVSDRPGGYTRILKLGNRLGDNAQMAYIELVDFNEEYTTDKPIRKKVRRTRKKNIKLDNKEEASPNVEEVIQDETKEASPNVAEVVQDETKEASPNVEEVVQDETKEASSNVEEVVQDETKEASSNVEEVVQDETKEEKKNNINPENKEQKGE